MKKLQKTQRYISFVPIVSFLIVLIITAFELKRNKVKMAKWAHFMAIFFGAGIATTILNDVLLSGQFPLLNFIASWIILTFASLLFVDLQCKCISENVSVTEEEKDETVVSASDTPKKLQMFSKNKKIWKALLVFVIPLIVAVIFVSVKISSGVKNHKEMTIADTNGAEDFSLNTLTQEDILKEANDYTMWKVGSSREGESSGIDDYRLEKVDRDKVHQYADSFSGVTVVHATKCNADTLTLHIESKVESGNFLVFVLVDGVLYEEIAPNTNKEISLADVNGKTVTVKIAGESADFDITVSRK